MGGFLDDAREMVDGSRRKRGTQIQGNDARRAQAPGRAYPLDRLRAFIGAKRSPRSMGSPDVDLTIPPYDPQTMYHGPPLVNIPAAVQAALFINDAGWYIQAKAGQWGNVAKPFFDIADGINRSVQGFVLAYNRFIEQTLEQTDQAIEMMKYYPKVIIDKAHAVVAEVMEEVKKLPATIEFWTKDAASKVMTALNTAFATLKADISKAIAAATTALKADLAKAMTAINGIVSQVQTQLQALQSQITSAINQVKADVVGSVNTSQAAILKNAGAAQAAIIKSTKDAQAAVIADATKAKTELRAFVNDLITKLPKQVATATADELVRRGQAAFTIPSTPAPSTPGKAPWQFWGNLAGVAGARAYPKLYELFHRFGLTIAPQEARTMIAGLFAGDFIGRREAMPGGMDQDVEPPENDRWTRDPIISEQFTEPFTQSEAYPRGRLTRGERL